MIIRSLVISASCLLFSHNATAAPTFRVQIDEESGSVNAFVSAPEANVLYDLLLNAVPIRNLPNGGYLEGGHVTCAQTTGVFALKKTLCAFNFDKSGFTTVETPRFKSKSSFVSGDIKIRSMEPEGFAHVRVTGPAARILFDTLEFPMDPDGRKIGFTALCSKSDRIEYSCSFNVNARGFADFPEQDIER